MRPIADCLPFIPSLNSSQAKTKTRAPFPVWSGSTTKPVHFMPLSKKDASILYVKAEAFERQTRKPGKQDGDVGRNGLKILYALLFYFLNYKTGRLDPSQKAIARQANISERSVTRGLTKLKAAGILNWVNRAGETRDEKGRYCQYQTTNAYAVLPSSQWKGFIEDIRHNPPPPHPTAWGATPPLPDLITQALTEIKHGERATALTILETDPKDTVAGALARYWRALEQQNRQ